VLQVSENRDPKRDRSNIAFGVQGHHAFIRNLFTLAKLALSSGSARYLRL
jgi:hypothetical protein